MDRHATFLWMKDILDHMAQCHEEWQLADSSSERYLAESIRRDLDEFRSLCDRLSVKSTSGKTCCGAF